MSLDFFKLGIFKVTNSSTSVIEKILLNPPSCKQITYFYYALCSYEVVNTQDLRRLWEGELQLTITEEEWEQVWSQANKISICNRHQSYSAQHCA